MATLTIQIPGDKHDWLRSLANSRGIDLNELFAQLATEDSRLVRELGLEPGEDVKLYETHLRHTAIKQVRGSASGILNYVRGRTKINDAQSRQSHFE